MHPDLDRGEPTDIGAPWTAARFHVDPEVTVAFTLGGVRCPVTEPTEVVVDADIVESYGATGYAAWRAPVAYDSPRLQFEGETPQVHRLG